MQRPTIQRVLSTLALVFLLGTSLACGVGGDEPIEQNYAAGRVRFGSQCEPFVAAAGTTLPAGRDVCLELVLEGYYTNGTLEATVMRGAQAVGTSTVTFTQARALGARLTSGRAESYVTFSFRGGLPPGEYRMVITRNGQPAADYPFQVR